MKNIVLMKNSTKKYFQELMPKIPIALTSARFRPLGSLSQEALAVALGLIPVQTTSAAL
ncbi:hypothetical protein [Xanthomonas hortorum]|uniref:hypothetical protein n=1 Tax=Xanthomonas hortorum TaxID=56454 RepID=UPI000AC18C13|nr:hypothetical protein [Xanthomonas hortorum]MCC8662734.1 hypothetical protein [Xanthomonas hortorum pv. gardneri]MCC8708244.1 hypothetical protein [Xanthomonas hortorum pv. gardneri]MCC8716869.1 hypothetical protein [Xanthomonas hortorum pv. gardneri]MCC8721228.1 hypothetical protein [Xanthomonas hortorum pv. gardneri]